MNLYILTAALLLAGVILLLKPARARAHCDTMDGPTARDGLAALESGNITHALKWVEEQHEPELKAIFTLSLKVRALGDEARELADRYFLENLVRLHRAGEGEGFTGIRPRGVPIDEKVAAADEAIATGSLKPLKGLFTAREMPELEKRFHTARSLMGFDPDDLPAARRYIAAYVSFFKLAEGEEHAHAVHGAGGGHPAHETHRAH